MDHAQTVLFGLGEHCVDGQLMLLSPAALGMEPVARQVEVRWSASVVEVGQSNRDVNHTIH